MSFAPSPSHHHFYRWDSTISQSWAVHGIGLPALLVKDGDSTLQNQKSFSTINNMNCERDNGDLSTINGI